MKIVIKKPQIESFVLMFFLLLPVLRDFVFSHIPLGYYLMDVILVVMIGFCAFANQRNMSEYIDIIVLYLVIFLLFAFKFLGDSSMGVWLTREFGVRHMFIMGGIFGYGVIRIQKNVNRMLVTMRWAGIILGVYYAYKSLEVLRNGFWRYYQFGQYWQSTSNMSWSYGVLLAICLLSIFLLIDKKVIVVVPMAIGLLGIMVYGSRGTVVSLALGVLLTVLFVNEGKLKTRNYIAIGLFIALILFLFSDTGLAIITSWFQSHGLSSRFIDLFTLQQTFDVASHGRVRIWEKVIEMLMNMPLLGYGVFGERNAVYDLGYRWGYAHNIFLELLVSFGWIFGTIIIILMIVGCVRFFRSATDKKERLLFTIFLTVSFELLLSGTMWLHYGVWCLLGLYVNHYKNMRKAQHNQSSYWS